MNCSAKLQGIAKLQRCGGYGIFLLFVIASFFLKVSLFVAGEQDVKVEYTSVDLRDPFKSLVKKIQVIPLEEEAEQVLPSREIILPPLFLQGVIWDTSMPEAIIDGRIVRIKDRIKEAEVVDINKEGVILLFQNKRFVIKPKGGE